MCGEYFLTSPEEKMTSDRDTIKRGVFIISAAAIMYASLNTVLYDTALASSNNNNAKPKKTLLNATKTVTPPTIDGILNEELWQQTMGYSGFKTTEPKIGEPSKEKTVVYIAYDDNNLYFAIKCYDSQPDKIKASITKRDGIYEEDLVGILLDTYNDRQNALGFIVNPLGVQGDLVENVNGMMDISQDFIWESAGTINPEGYSVETRIPLKSIRFQNAKDVTMGVGFLRRNIRNSEMSAFPFYTPEKGSMVEQLGEIVFHGIKYKRTFELLPSITNKNTNGEDETDNGTSLGITGKVGLTSTLTGDVTINPDFSQVESDASQIEFNRRSAVIYEEKRPFFLEGMSDFIIAGIGGENPVPVVVHTRKIVEPVAGIKISGKVNSTNSISAIFAADESPKYLPESRKKENAYFEIIRHKKLFGEGNYLGSIITSRELLDDHNTVAGLDGRYRFNKSVVEFNYLYLNKKEKGSATGGHSAGVTLNYEDKKHYAELSIYDISKDFNLPIGFVDRSGLRTLNVTGVRIFYPSSKLLQQIYIMYDGNLRNDKYYQMNENSHTLGVSLSMPRSSYIYLSYSKATEVFANKLFDLGSLSFNLSSQPTKSISGSISYQRSGKPFYDPNTPFQGDEQGIQVMLTIQPDDKINIEASTITAAFRDRKSGNNVYDTGIYRGKLTYNLHKYLFFRGIVEKNGFTKNITTDFLASFTYIPGTVFHIGYGSLYEKDNITRPDKFFETRHSLFAKISYNWRLN